MSLEELKKDNRPKEIQCQLQSINPKRYADVI